MGRSAILDELRRRRASLLPLALPGLAATFLLLLAAGAGADYVAVGWGGAITTSPDGETWTQQQPGLPVSFFSVAPGSPWVAVGASGEAYSSPDGITWTATPTGTLEWLRGVASDGQAWVAVGTGATILRSTDGATWTPVASPTTVQLNGVATDGDGWVAVGAAGTVLTSPDGLTWTIGPSLAGTLNGIAHGAGGWTAVGADGAVFRSADAATWTPESSGIDADLEGVGWAGGKWVAVGQEGTILHSADAVSWAAAETGVTSTVFAVAPACQGLWVAVGENGLLLTSPDGAAWTAKPSDMSSHLRGAGCIASSPATLSCAPVTVPVGQAALLHATGGTAPYAWSSGGTPSSGSGPDYSPTFGQPGTFQVTLADAGLPPYEAQSAQCAVTVEGPSQDGSSSGGDGSFDPPSSGDGGSSGGTPSAFSCSPASQSTVPGGVVSVQAVGGKSPFTIQTPGGQAIGAPDASSDGGDKFSATYANPGGYSILLVDGAGQSAACGVSVVMPFAVSAGGPYSGMPGQPVHVAAVITGGVSAFTCRWDAEAGLVAQPQQCGTTIEVDAVGDVTVTVEVTDSAGDVRSASAVVRIREPASVPAAAIPCDDCATDGRLIHGQGDQGRPADACPLRPTLAAGRDPSCLDHDALTAAPPPAIDASVASTPAPPAAPGGLVAVLVAIGAAAVVALRFFLLREGLYVTLIVLFSRLKRTRLLDNPTRAFLVEQIAEHPGTHFRELVRASGKGRGTVQHHLAVLVQGGVIQSLDVAGMTGYRLTETAWDEKLPLSRALRAPQAKRCLEILQEEYCVTVTDLAERCSITYAGAMYHVRRLARAGLIEVLQGEGDVRKARLLSSQMEMPAAHDGARATQ